MADGLAAAHQAGILRRDIEPANILVVKNGYAKLADFGLAKLEERIGPAEPTRTLTESPTRPGMIRGTIPYMSPKQASGRALDARSYIFSFSVVLYELLAGKRPFTGLGYMGRARTWRAARLFLANAGGLTWIEAGAGQPRLLFSEMTGRGHVQVAAGGCGDVGALLAAAGAVRE